MKFKKAITVVVALACSFVALFSVVGCTTQEQPEERRDVLITVAVLNNAGEKKAISEFINAFKASQSTIDVKAKYIDPIYYTPVLTDWAGDTCRRRLDGGR